MKHVITLISALVFMSATVNGDDIKRNKKHNNKAVAVAPFVWGNPGDEAPAELQSSNPVKVQVPVAPFVWGNSDEIPQVVESAKRRTTSVPVAPFVYGSPDDEISLDLQTSLAVQLIK